MFGDHYAPARQLLAVVQSVVGPTREMNDVQKARTGGRWVHHGEYRGRPLRFVITHQYTTNSVGRLLGVELWAPLGGRPVELLLDFPLLLPGQTRAPLPDNAGSLFPHGITSGFPQDVVRSAFDASTTAVVNAAIGPQGLRVATDGDWLSVFVHVGDAVPFSSAPASMPGDAEVTRSLDFVFGLAERLVGAFDYAHAEALRAGGPAAAAQWLATQHAAARLRREKSLAAKTTAVIVAVFIMAGVVMLVTVIIALARC